MHSFVRLAHNALGVAVFAGIVLSTAAVTLSLNPVAHTGGVLVGLKGQVAGEATSKVVSNLLPLELSDAHTGEYYQSQLLSNDKGGYAYHINFPANIQRTVRGFLVRVTNPNSAAQTLEIKVKVPSQLANSIAVQVGGQQVYTPAGVGAATAIIAIPANQTLSLPFEVVFNQQIGFPTELEFSFSWRQ